MLREELAEFRQCSRSMAVGGNSLRYISKIMNYDSHLVEVVTIVCLQGISCDFLETLQSKEIRQRSKLHQRNSFRRMRCTRIDVAKGKVDC